MPAAVDDVAVTLDIAEPVREHEVELPSGTNELPLSEGIEHQRRDRNGALTGYRLGPTDLVVPSGTLPHMNCLGLEINLLPAKPAQLGGAEATEDRREKQ